MRESEEQREESVVDMEREREREREGFWLREWADTPKLSSFVSWLLLPTRMDET